MDTQVKTISELKIAEYFTKFQINIEYGEGESFRPVLHIFERDKLPKNEYPHDHPYGMTIHILRGGYTEETFIFNKSGTLSINKIERKPGTTHRVEAEHIHRLISMPEKDCWTLAIPDWPPIR